MKMREQESSSSSSSLTENNNYNDATDNKTDAGSVAETQSLVFEIEDEHGNNTTFSVAERPQQQKQQQQQQRVSIWAGRRMLRRRDCIWLGITVLALVGVVVVGTIWFGLDNSNDEASPSLRSPNNDNKDNTTAAPPKNNNQPQTTIDNNAAGNVDDIDDTILMRPFSRLDPVADVGFYPMENRPAATKPPQGVLQNLVSSPLPTNAWYQNFLMLNDDNEPSPIHRAYAIPYVLDAAGPMAGLRVHAGRIQALDSSAEFLVNEDQGLTMGAVVVADDDDDNTTTRRIDRRYMVQEATKLAVTLNWGNGIMSSPIVKGMPYATMIYNKTTLFQSSDNNNKNPAATNSNLPVQPTIAFQVPIGQVIIDADEQSSSTSTNVDDSSAAAAAATFLVQHELQVHIPSSDFMWLVFVSEPVYIQRVPNFNTPAGNNGGDGDFLQIVRFSNDDDDNDVFTVRVALAKTCATGANPIYCQRKENGPNYYAGTNDQYTNLLRRHAHLYPGSSAVFSMAAMESDENGRDQSLLTFDWDVQTTGSVHPLANGDEELLALALPHHFDMHFATHSAKSTNERFCWDSMSGWACTVEGSKWHFVKSLPEVGFRAPRPPVVWAIPNLTQSLVEDMEFRIPDNYQRGAGDTYFSGKLLARVARVLVIAEEVQELCAKPKGSNYSDACSQSILPGKDAMQAALDSLRGSLDTWLSKQAEAPFVYEVSSWGGLVSCGCYYEDDGCSNQYPDCPAFSDQGLNFGNGFYNDMHFHYGYFIYAAAVLAHFDPSWGIKQYEKVLALVRNIANPSANDPFFPLLRHVDPYQGHSWASGITQPVLRNGRNQESSSEAICSYEAVAIFGQTMLSIFESKGSNEDQKKSAEAVLYIGKTILSMEIQSTQFYWHLRKDEDVDLFEGYRHNAVGIMWQTMFQFQTFFGGSPYFIYGIQLLPLTVASENRDDLPWIRRIYPDLEVSCTEDCISSGWSIQLLALLATGGHMQKAFDETLKLPDSVFDTPGGNGHSRSNTQWYIATRPPIENPIPLRQASSQGSLDCGKPESCNAQVLESMAGDYTCGARIRWLITNSGLSEEDACAQVAGDEFPRECNGCF